MKYSKIEFWASVMILLLALFSTNEAALYDFYDTINTIHRSDLTLLTVLTPYWLLVAIAYVVFLTVNYYVVPKFILKNRVGPGIGLAFGCMVIASIMFMFPLTQIQNHTHSGADYELINAKYFTRGLAYLTFGLVIYICYFLIREFIIYQHRQAISKTNMSSRIIRQIILVCCTWVAVIFPLTLLHNTGLFEVLFGPMFIVAPYCIIIYFLNLYWLIPGYKQGRIPNRLMYLLMLGSCCLAAGCIEVAFLTQTYRFSFLGYVVFFWCVPTPVTIALSWRVYHRNEVIYQQLTSLKTALGTSNANLQYLRSQINPHFLFNALNTLYGTALMEKADKTGEGIQKLGDMMRFMLHENNQDKIALNRELDYLRNYIDLQNMRLALSPNLVIDIRIEEIAGYYEIAPMLLIPFVENAYKHGVSLQEQSWINLDLYKHDNVLHLDVRNSVHPVNANDPERDQSGTGLDNVKQRLQLVYPERHELVIRQNAREFFIHLSLTLTTQTL